MHVAHRTAVRFCLGLRDAVVHRPCPAAHFLRQRQRVDLRRNLSRPGVRVAVGVPVRMGVVVVIPLRLAFLLAADEHAHVRTRDAGGGGGLGAHLDARQAEAVHRAEKSLPVVEQFIESRHQHIACRAHRAFKIQGFHGAPPILPSD